MDTKEQIKIMQHFVDGGEVEYYDRLDSRWLPVREPLWNWYGSTYRVKPEPRECWGFNATNYKSGMVFWKREEAEAFWKDEEGEIIHLLEVTD